MGEDSNFWAIGVSGETQLALVETGGQFGRDQSLWNTVTLGEIESQSRLKATSVQIDNLGRDCINLSRDQA